MKGVCGELGSVNQGRFCPHAILGHPPENKKKKSGNYLQKLKKKSGKIYVERIPDIHTNFKKLLKQRINLLITDIDAGYNILHQRFTPVEVGSVTHHPNPVMTKPLYLILSKKIKRND